MFMEINETFWCFWLFHDKVLLKWTSPNSNCHLIGIIDSKLQALLPLFSPAAAILELNSAFHNSTSTTAHARTKKWSGGTAPLFRALRKAMDTDQRTSSHRSGTTDGAVWFPTKNRRLGCPRSPGMWQFTPIYCFCDWSHPMQTSPAEEKPQTYGAATQLLSLRSAAARREEACLLRAGWPEPVRMNTPCVGIRPWCPWLNRERRGQRHVPV